MNRAQPASSSALPNNKKHTALPGSIAEKETMIGFSGLTAFSACQMARLAKRLRAAITTIILRIKKAFRNRRPLTSRVGTHHTAAPDIANRTAVIDGISAHPGETPFRNEIS